MIKETGNKINWISKKTKLLDCYPNFLIETSPLLYFWSDFLYFYCSISHKDTRFKMPRFLRWNIMFIWPAFPFILFWFTDFNGMTIHLDLFMPTGKRFAYILCIYLHFCAFYQDLFAHGCMILSILILKGFANKFIWPINGTLTGTSTRIQSGPGIIDYEEIIHTLHLRWSGA